MNIEQEINAIKKKLKDHDKRLNIFEKDDKDNKKSNKTKNKSITELFEQLKFEKFFKDKRTTKQIFNKLSEKGYTYRRPQSLTDPLQRATKQGILQRKKTDDGWIYFE